MDPVKTRLQRHAHRRVFLAVCLLVVTGCTDKTMRLQSPAAFEEALADVRLVRDVCVPYGGHPLQIHAEVLVGNLANTGSDPPPSAARSMLLKEMQRRDVHRPNEVLASPTTSLASARGYLRPGIRKGDRFDIEVFVPRDSDTTSLRDGVMYQTRLRERAVLGGQIREGDDLALAKGPILVDPMADAERDSSELRRGVILGGGIALKSRPLGLMLKPDEKDIRTSARIGAAINRRFHITNQGIKSGVAKPKTDGYVELALHPRYKDNLERYLRIVRNVALREDENQRHVRLQLLERQLLDPLTAEVAAIRLEAVGSDAVGVLKKGVASSNPEVRFFAAEALAYLDEESAAGALAEAARDQPAFRADALAALGAMDDPAARDELVKLMDATSAETRYGAFRALWAMNENDPAVRGEDLNAKFSYHVVRSQGPPMVHVTRSTRPEIVLFGSDLRLRTPLILDAGSVIHVNARDDGQVVVSRFAPGAEDRELKVSPRVDEVVRAIVELGGTYPDVVQALAQAKATRSLPCRFEVDAIPSRKRSYQPSKASLAKNDQRPRDNKAGSDLSTPPDDARPARPKSGKEAAADRESSWPLTRYVGRIITRTRN